MTKFKLLPGEVPRTLKGVIFDCDGVLIDSRTANAEYYNRVLKALKLPPLTEEQEAFTYMATADEALQSITPPALHARLPEICNGQVNYMRDIMPLIQLEQGVMDFLKFLRQHKVHCAVHTNRSGGMAVVIDTFDLASYFQPVVTALTVQPKPSPDGVRYILDAWHAAPEEVLFVGDSLNDAQAALGGGVYFAAYRNPQLMANVNVGSFEQLTGLLQAGPLS